MSENPDPLLPEPGRPDAGDSQGHRPDPESSDEVAPPVAPPGGLQAGDPNSETDGSKDDEKWPIGFILTISLVGVYLGYRLIQGVVLLVQWVF